MAFSVSAHIKRIKKFTTYVREYKITLIFNDTVRMQKGIIQLSLPSSKDQPIISDGLGVIKKKKHTLNLMNPKPFAKLSTLPPAQNVPK